MPLPPTPYLPLVGFDLTGANNLPGWPAFAPQLGDLLNLLAASAAAPLSDRVAVDDDVTSGSALLDVTLTPGTYQVSLLVMVETVGGTGGDGLLIEQDSTLTLAAGQSISVWAIEGTAAAQFIVPAGSAALGFSGAAETVFRVEGLLEVTGAGRLGYRVGAQGTPTSVTLKAGSGLVVTKLG